MAERSILVGMAEIYVVKGRAQLCCMGLGSCVAILALDAEAGIAGGAHVLLPESPSGAAVDKPGKFADTAIPELLTRLEAQGADRSRLRIALIGGASVVKFGGTPSPATQIGDRNVAAVQALLASLELKVVQNETGGNLGRTVTFDTETGAIRVRTVSRGDREVARLKEAA